MEYVGKALTHPIRRADRPEHMLQEAEHNQTEGDANEAVPEDRGTDRGTEALKHRLIESEPGLVPAVRDTWHAEVDPRGHCSAGTEDQPEAAEAVDVRKRVHKGDQPHQSPEGSASEPPQALLIARPDGRERHDETGDDRGVDARVVKPDEEYVADQTRGGALDGELDVLGIGEGIGQEQARPRFLGSLLRPLDPDREHDLVESSLHVRERRPPSGGGSGT